MPAEHQRVFFIEEKASRAPESFLYRGKGLPDAREFSLSRKRPARRQRPEPRGFSFIVEKETIRTRAPEALKRHVFCAVCPCRPAGPALGRFYYIFQAATAGSIIVKRRFSRSSSIHLHNSRLGFRLAFRDLSSRLVRLDPG